MIRCIEEEIVERKHHLRGRSKSKSKEIRMIDLRGSRIEKLVCTSKEGDMKKREIWNDNKFSFWHISIMVTWLISLVGWSIEFSINAKEGDCWNMIEKIIIKDIEEGKLMIKNVFNHCFVTDVKNSIWWNDNFLYDPSTII